MNKSRIRINTDTAWLVSALGVRDSGELDEGESGSGTKLFFERGDEVGVDDLAHTIDGDAFIERVGAVEKDDHIVEWLDGSTQVIIQLDLRHYSDKRTDIQPELVNYPKMKIIRNYRKSHINCSKNSNILKTI